MENITIKELGTLAGIVLSLITLGTVIIRPFISINKNLTKMTGILNDIQKEIGISVDDRRVLHEKVDYNDKRLDDHEIVLTRHDERISHVEKRG